MKKIPTLKQAREQVKAICPGFTISKHYGKYKVRLGYETYYTDDINDALDTAVHMYVEAVEFARKASHSRN